MHCYMIVRIIIVLTCDPCASTSLKTDSFIELLLLDKYREIGSHYKYMHVCPCV